jgi:trans-aconitate methyltransferase
MEYDRTPMPANYDAGRGYRPAVMAAWLERIARWVPNGLAWSLDLGCGTGRYSGALSTRFASPVVAIDPSEKMLAEAAKKMAPNVRYVRATLKPYLWLMEQSTWCSCRWFSTISTIHNKLFASAVVCFARAALCACGRGPLIRQKTNPMSRSFLPREKFFSSFSRLNHQLKRSSLLPVSLLPPMNLSAARRERTGALTRINSHTGPIQFSFKCQITNLKKASLLCGRAL